jgi:alkylation response protein AidB-like acyl-CoA dehydrogenase
MSTHSDVESVEDFRSRARSWIRENLAPLVPGHAGVMVGTTDEEELAEVTRSRQLQRMLFDAGLAGITIPRDYGGQGLTREHQQALNEEMDGREYPVHLQIPTMVPCAAVINEFGTHDQKLEHLPRILKGEEIWIQFLSEPSGGSDVAGALTSAVRDGDEWILNGSKVWSSGAWWSDWALCLARTNWDVPKHRGLSVFMLPIYQPGIEIQRIEMLSGSRDFCQEFLTDVRVPDSDRIGDVDQGWTVGTAWMMHERMAHNSPYVTIPAGSGGAAAYAPPPLAAIAQDRGLLEDARVRDLIGEERILEVIGGSLNRRLGEGMRSGRMHAQSSAIGRLYHGVSSTRQRDIAFDISGDASGAWLTEDRADTIGTQWLMRQVSCIGGGTTEISRNVISERVLGMPREAAPDRDIAFREVRRGASKG